MIVIPSDGRQRARGVYVLINERLTPPPPPGRGHHAARMTMSCVARRSRHAGGDTLGVGVPMSSHIGHDDVVVA
jgi:hypothetical protein